MPGADERHIQVCHGQGVRVVHVVVVVVVVHQEGMAEAKLIVR